MTAFPERGIAASRVRLLAAGALLALGAVAVYVASAIGDESVVRHQGMHLVANYDQDPDGTKYRTGTDIAFWGDLAILGNLDQGTGPIASPPGGFRIMDISDPEDPQLEGKYVCSGDQSDVSIWKDLVITSVDKPAPELCTTGETWEGLRIVSIADPASPEIVKTVRTRCGSHTHTINPDLPNQRLLVYVLSYPLAGRYNPAGEVGPVAAGGRGCNAIDHGRISVVAVPLKAPENSSVLGTPSVRETPADTKVIGCHDVSVFLEDDLAAAACLTESEIWDLSDPVHPEVIARIPNPAGMDLSHSTTFSNDGETLVIGAELGGAAASPGCFTGEQDDPLGGLFFFDISDPQAPQHVGSFKLPQQVATLLCTAHQFNVVPLLGERDILVSSWYTGATSLIDFTDPSKPEQIAYYIPEETLAPDPERIEGAAWASYWYRGHVYSSNFDEDVNSISPRSRGLDVFEVDKPFVPRALKLPHLNPQVQKPLPDSAE